VLGSSASVAYVAFLMSSLVASIVLTVLLNVMIRVFPGTSADARARQVFGEEQARPDELPSVDEQPRVRLYFPWRQMLLWSAVLTILLNVIRLF